MNSPSKTTAILALAPFWWTTSLSAADAPHDPLWRKAVAVAAANADWVPGLVIFRAEFQHKGESRGSREMWQRCRPGPKGEVVKETVKILKDGKDVTKQERTKSKETKNATDEGWSPFDADVQERLSLKMTGRSRVITGRDCVGFDFELRNTNGPVLRGTAWLEKETGVPSEIENMIPDPLPDKHLKSMALTARYEITTNGVWLAKTIETAATASMLSIKLDTRSTMTFSEYWKMSQHERTLGKDKK